MTANHELQLMLVNTLRKVSATILTETVCLTWCKELESSSTARICLALSFLIQAPNDDVVPAVQSHLQALFMHKSSVQPML